MAPPRTAHLVCDACPPLALWVVHATALGGTTASRTGATSSTVGTGGAPTTQALQREAPNKTPTDARERLARAAKQALGKPGTLGQLSLLHLHLRCRRIHTDDAKKGTHDSVRLEPAPPFPSPVRACLPASVRSEPSAASRAARRRPFALTATAPPPPDAAGTRKIRSCFTAPSPR